MRYTKCTVHLSLTVRPKQANQDLATLPLYVSPTDEAFSQGGQGPGARVGTAMTGGGLEQKLPLLVSP